MTTHSIYRLGDRRICLECGSSHAPDRPGHVIFAVCKLQAERRRTRMPVRHAGLPVGFAAADLNGGLPMNRIIGFDAGEYRLNCEATEL